MSNQQSAAVVLGAGGGIGSELVRELLAGTAHDLVVAGTRRPEETASACADTGGVQPRLLRLSVDTTDPESLAALARDLGERQLRITTFVHAVGVLHDSRADPEKRLADLELDALEHVFRINAFAGILALRYLAPLFARQGSVRAGLLSARVGSIGDNRLGGWYAYRASKAALNQFVRTAAIELRRRNPETVCVALHPGTVDTPLSEPFQARVPERQLFDRQRAARQLLAVLDGLDASDSGGFFAWDGKAIPW